MSEAMRVEVTDLYDAFHKVAQLLWHRFEFQGRGTGSSGQLGPRFDELMDQLERDLFFAACGRRLWAHTEVQVAPDQIPQLLSICDAEGVERPGAAGQYHSHGFEWGTPKDVSVTNLVVAADLLGDDRRTVRLFVHAPGAA